MNDIITLNDPIVYPFYVGIGVFSMFTIYHTHLSYRFQGPYRDKIFYYFCHLLTVIPIVLYIYIICDVEISGIVTRDRYLRTFYLEWTFSTPLILMNLGRLCNFTLQYYIYITIMDLIMIISGYISYLSNNPAIIYSFYAVGCAIYITLMVIFIRQFKIFNREKHNIPPTHIYRDKIRYKCYKYLSISIASLWIFYPITHILLKLNTISVDTSVIILITLDLLSKGIFTNLLLGSREVYKTPTSFLGRISKKVLRIHPLNNSISNNKLEEIMETSKSSSSVESTKKVKEEKPIDKLQQSIPDPKNNLNDTSPKSPRDIQLAVVHGRQKCKELRVVIPENNYVVVPELVVGVNTNEEDDTKNECKRDLNNEVINPATSIIITKVNTYVPSLESVTE